MQALRGRIPRALRNHKTPEGWVYGQYCRRTMRVRSCNHTSFLFDLCRLSVSPMSDRMWTNSGGEKDGAGSGSRTRTGRRPNRF